MTHLSKRAKLVSYFMLENSDEIGGGFMAREMTDEEKKEYDLLTANMEQISLRLEELTARPTTYGYARVSTYGQAAHGNSLAEQKRQLRKAGGTSDRPPEGRIPRRTA